MYFIKQHTEKYSRKKGFTLVEVLISIVIFSFMIAIATFSFRFYIDVVKKTFVQFPQEAMAYSRLRDAVDSMFYYVCQKRDILGKMKFYYFFYGDSKKMEFISRKPIFSHRLSVCKIEMQKNNLIWEESPVYSKVNDYKNPSLVNPKKKILFENIDNIFISYIVDGKKTERVEGKIPQEIRLMIETDNNRKITMIFSVKSDFNDKKEWSIYNYYNY